MKFTAKKRDLKLELVLLDGTEKAIEGPEFGGRQAGELAQRMNAGGLAFDRLEPEERTPIAAGDLFGDQLSMVYTDVDSKWWVDNLDISTIKDVRSYVIAELLGMETGEAGSGK